MQPGAKSESLREEMEETANRMEICRVSHQTEQIINYVLLGVFPSLIYKCCEHIRHK